MSQEVIGILFLVKEVEHISEKFSKRDFIIKLEGQYPQHICFQLTKDKTDMIEVYKVGEQIKVHYNLRGREHQGRYFNTLEAWRLERVSNVTTEEPVHVYDTQRPSVSGTQDDLPF